MSKNRLAAGLGPVLKRGASSAATPALSWTGAKCRHVQIFDFKRHGDFMYVGGIGEAHDGNPSDVAEAGAAAGVGIEHAAGVDLVRLIEFVHKRHFGNDGLGDRLLRVDPAVELLYRFVPFAFQLILDVAVVLVGFGQTNA